MRRLLALLLVLVLGLPGLALAAGEPAAPSGLTATAATTSQIDLRWTDNADNEAGFAIERRTGGGDWVQVATTGPNAPVFSDTGLTPGTTYSYRVRAYNAAGFSDYSNTASATTLVEPPSAPTDLHAEAVSENRVDLSWTDTSSNEDGFRIERSTGSGDYALVATVAAGAQAYSDTGLTAGTTYRYRVAAYNSGGQSSYAGPATVTTPGSALPAAPSNLAAQAVSTSRIDLTWTDNASNETGFKIERKKGSGGTYSQIDTVGANVTSYASRNLSSDTTYYYRVRAYNAAGNSAYSNEASATTLGEVPDAPSELAVTLLTSTSVRLTWTDNSDNEQGFKIERRKSGGSWSQIATVGEDVERYTNTGLEKNTVYYYRVRAYNASGDSDYSEAVSIDTGGSGGVPEAPDGLTATVLSATSVKLEWQDNSDRESGFKIERRESGGSWTQIATVGRNVETYTASGLKRDTRYSFRVRAYNDSGNSDYSNEVSVTTTNVPAAPSSLAATAQSSSQVRLTWKDNSGNESGFKIERRKAGGSYSQVATVERNVEYYVLSGLEPDTLYSFRVRAYNADGNSEYSNEASARTQAAPARVIVLRVGSTAYTVNGQSRTMDVAPVISEGRTLLPVRFVAEGIGASVGWSSAERKVTISMNGTTIEMWIGRNLARVNGGYRLIDSTNASVTPIIVAPGRTMVPLRFVSEGLGCKVDWNASTRQVTVTYPAS
ncbi:MAG: fibronectin type III domain-containing protein [Syntrophomonadaceae bacterium]|jgi:transcriptional regulator CtsR|nr:fibronectin type III domain-containing protein [Syntrophomonadaceae bacterium]MDH7497494.1 fibronectin type III domain-containing protein [Syntrophomonadaceae bacterium]